MILFSSLRNRISIFKHRLEVRNELLRVNSWLVELKSFAIGSDEILGKVPLDFTFGKLLLEVLVDGVGTVALNVRLVKNWERSVVVLHHPGLDLIA